VVTLARPEVREAVIAVPDKLAEQLSHTRDFTITVNLERVSMKAAGVRAIDPIADPNTRTRNVFLTLNDPPEAFRLGATVSVTFSRPVAAHVDLPATALLEKDGKAFVWVVDPAKSTVSQREVTVGSREGDGIVVTSGIAAGERIVIAGVHSLTAGQVVKVPQ
jgi:RND family efflux transporter MFP subunit